MLTVSCNQHGDICHSNPTKSLNTSSKSYPLQDWQQEIKIYEGKQEGKPGKFLRSVHEHCKDSNIKLFQPAYVSGNMSGFLGGPIEYVGKTKYEFREAFINISDAILAVGGYEGTLTEARLALLSGKPTVIVRNYDAVGTYLSSSRKYRKFNNIHIVDSLQNAADKLLELY